MNASIALTGQVCGRIDEIKPAAQIIAEVCAEFDEVVNSLHRLYAS